MMLHIK